MKNHDYFLGFYSVSCILISVDNPKKWKAESGEATVVLPDYFEALNEDFRYQLTCVGGFANVYIADKVNNNQFKIAGGAKDLEVSWQVTGVRHDKQALEHMPAIEEYKK